MLLQLIVVSRSTLSSGVPSSSNFPLSSLVLFFKESRTPVAVSSFAGLLKPPSVGKLLTTQAFSNFWVEGRAC